jgi:RNA polymerase sigma factor (sigma-70 family)
MLTEEVIVSRIDEVRDLAHWYLDRIRKTASTPRFMDREDVIQEVVILCLHGIRRNGPMDIKLSTFVANNTWWTLGKLHRRAAEKLEHERRYLREYRYRRRYVVTEDKDAGLLAEDVWKAVDTLEPAQTHVIRSIYGGERIRTMPGIARAMGRTKQRVQQIKAKALEELQECLA